MHITNHLVKDLVSPPLAKAYMDKTFVQYKRRRLGPVIIFLMANPIAVLLTTGSDVLIIYVKSYILKAIRYMNEVELKRN